MFIFCFEDGLGLDSTTQTRLLETISSRNPMLSTKLLIHNEIVSKCLLLYGTDNQIRKYSNLLINGLLSSAYCYGEPHTGCDIGNFKMTAVRDDQCYVLNGVKSRVMLANDENKILFLVFCRITNKASFVASDTQDFGILLVDYDAQNSQSKIKLTKKTTLANNMGLYDVEFEDVLVNLDAAISAQSPDAVKIFTDLFDTARFQIGSICIGALKEHLTDAVDYVLKTRQFEMPLSDMDMVKERLCKIQSRLYAMESTVYMTSGIVDSYANADVAVESNLTKLYCTQAFNDSIRDLQDIYSMNVPAGFDELQRLGQLLSCFLNTNDVLKQYVGIVCASHVGVNQAENVRKLNDKLNHPAFLLREFMRQMRLKKNLTNSKNSVFYLWEKGIADFLSD
jgi:alkylation response protein AidB-like acyl-CoA dehydrogenase